MILEQEVDRIRAVRERISAKCRNDPKQLLEYYRTLSRELRESGEFRFAEAQARPPEQAEKLTD